MSLLQFFRIFNRNLNLYLLCSIVMAAVVYFLTRDAARKYNTETEFYTGITTGLNVENLGETKVDRNGAISEYDNLINIIKSRYTLEEVGYRLMVQHMMLDSVNPYIIDREANMLFRSFMPETVEKELVVSNSPEETYQNLIEYRKANFGSERMKLAFDAETSPYSYKAIGKLGVKRIQNSDLLRIEYSWTDAGITQNTLKILNSVFTKNLAKVKAGQSNDVVAYYEEQVRLAAERLQNAEQRLQDFRINNKIINYMEQTRSLTQKKEAMEDEYLKELAKLEAAQAGFEKLNNQLALNSRIVKLGYDILEKKTELIDLRTKIAELEAFYNDRDLINKLNNRADRLKEEVSTQIIERYEYTRTTDGIPVMDIIQEWLDYSLKKDEASARVKIFKDRKEYFDNAYAEFSKLGAKAGRLERQIAIEEKDYLDALHGLRQAMLRRQSETISTGGLVFTLEPPFPLEPEPSKTMLLVMVAAIVGFMVPFIFTIVKEFMDSSIRTPDRAEKLSGLNLLGAYPDLTERGENRNIDFNWLHEKATGHLAQNLRLAAKEIGIGEGNTKYVVVFSTKKGDGKTTLTNSIANELISLNYRVLTLSPKDLPEDEVPLYDFIQYKNDKNFVKAEDVFEIVPIGYDPMEYDYCFLILDPIVTNPYPLNLLEQFHMSICVMAAHLSWSQADKTSLKNFKQTVNQEPVVVLNAVEVDFMQNVLGDIEKERSFVRQFVKRILTLELRKPNLKKSL